MKTHRFLWRRSLICVLALIVPLASQALELSGVKTVEAHLKDGSVKRLGSVRFTPGADGRVAFAMEWDTGVFQDHFLSMREFKCLDGPGEIACLVPYPHPQPRQVSKGDLGWLEHNLLFMFKLPSEFGARLWNGMYFELRDTGSQLWGTPVAVDLNVLGVPPERTDRAPLDASQRGELNVASRWLQTIVIR